MRVFFIIPNVKGILIKPTSPQIGIAYLAAMLLKEGHDVQIIDMRLGYSREHLLKRLQSFSPDYCCVTCVSMHYLDTFSLIRYIKKKGFQVIIGGPHVSVTRERILSECEADIAVKGEAEETITEICAGTALDGLPGVIYRRGGEIIENPDRPLIKDIDTIPFPAFHLFELDKYIDRKLPLVTSRGCPYGCIYCSIKLTMGRGFRARTAENVVDELQHWHDKYGYSYFAFNDDCFSLDLERAERICDLIIERGLKIRWEIRNGIRVDRVSERLLRKMRQAGCFYVSFGVESANQDVLDLMQKAITPQKAKEAILLADKVGIKRGAFFIIGLPGEDYEKFRKSLDFALSLPLNEVRFYNPIPFPGTALLEWVKENGRLIVPPEKYLNNIGSFDEEPVYETDDFPLAKRREAYRIAENYVIKYLMKSEFGPLFGTIGWMIWRPRITRPFIMVIGKKVWSVLRRIKSRVI